MKKLKWLLLANMSLCFLFLAGAATNPHTGEIDQLHRALF